MPKNTEKISPAEFPIFKGHNSCTVSTTIMKIIFHLYFMVNNIYAKG